MICCGAGDGNVIRYNISENDDKYYKSGGVVAVSDVVFQVYNNTIWSPPVGTDFSSISGPIQFHSPSFADLNMERSLCGQTEPATRQTAR